MSTTGATLPQTAESSSVSPWLDNDWINHANIYGAGEAEVSAATFDAGDQTYILVARNFNFSAIPDGATIDGVVVVVNARYATALVSIDHMKLLSDAGSGPVGTNLAETPTALTTSAANYTFGSSTEKWGNALTSAWVKSSAFGVGIGCLAGGSGNSNNDVYVDSVTMEVYYSVGTNPSVTQAVAVSDTPALDPLLLASSVTQGVTVTDVPTMSLQDATPPAVDKSESITVGDAPTIALPDALAASVTQSVSVSDVPAVELQALDPRAVDKSESITVTDTPTVAVEAATETPVVSTSEAVTVADGPRYYPDNIIVFDWVVVQLDALAASVTDSTTVADAPTAAVQDPAVDLAVNVSETVAVAETVSAAIPSEALSVSETIAVADTPTVSVIDAGAFTISVADAVTVGETVAASVGAPGISVSDTITVTDTPTVFVVSVAALEINTTQAITVADAPSATISALFISAADGVTVTDVATVSEPYTGISLSISVGEMIAVLVVATVLTYPVQYMGRRQREPVYYGGATAVKYQKKSRYGR